MTRPEARPNRGGPPGPQRRHATQQTRDTNDIQRYLRALFERDEPGALIEMHHYRDGMRSTFFAHTDTTAAARTILRLATATDVYVGAAPRMRPPAAETRSSASGRYGPRTTQPQRSTTYAARPQS